MTSGMRTAGRWLLGIVVGGTAGASADALAQGTAPAGPPAVASPVDAAATGEVPAHPFREPLADPTAASRATFAQQYLFGDWDGVRTRLADVGVRPTALFITDPFVDVAGGRRRGFAEYDLLALDVTADTDRLLGYGGGQFHVGFANNSGTSLARDYVGTLFPPQLADVADAHGRLTYLSYTQSLFDGRVSVRAGRVTINSVYGEEFAGSPYFKAFTSVAFDLVPVGLFLNATAAYGYPDATWGGRIKVAAGDGWYVMGGVYDGEPGNHEGARGGVDFSLRGPAFAIGEVGRRWNAGGRAAELPGSLKVGGYYQAPSRSGLAAGAAERSAVYAVADQAVAAWGPPEQDRHVGLFGTVVASPDPRANPVPFFFDVGVVGYGPFDARPHDFAAVGAAYGSYAGPLAGRPRSVAAGVGPEVTVEATYSLAVRPGVKAQPSVQYVVHPSGARRVPDAVVVGVQVVLSL